MRELEYPVYPSSTGPRLHWADIFAGVVVTLAVFATLNALGMGLGWLAASSAFEPTLEPAGAKPWWPAAAGVLAFGLGGWLASRLSDSGGRSDGVLYGLVCWASAGLAVIIVPAGAFGGTLDVPGTGLLVAATLTLQALAAALGGLAGARLYVPVPVESYRRARRHPAGVGR